ncbi:hypothetical protein COY25_04080 [Candidatus Uhrbacteria bacterium CG_4_10_14_0_2_um_filter_41_7]|uniref:Nudix hydrolase domain-containing protein n=1 Tax=Candidatus Uhrbacteria bacterium CG_4_9_14_3_um_filter_41_35 TaxID=1975034 RepID=A0A2M7XGX4_9BACT|nr:MAG: hypothetical protein COV92_02690 [Candidatus Uhrbacteria bacterium CG11_big_fil_rev_8_21_14_0_20_41_9]PIZ53124.1 MAG: hypothetical protein COY25_04080 [Candidatus Uhrbacteria bacterium CG_4_10_14_0_2_um_filter_41_7]PJA47124.1 MAG: hypothetical protein CO173_00065 [Candidatus Uhrbacteria bacterium CG_4_9_14_3_um_filter_41_35]
MRNFQKPLIVIGTLLELVIPLVAFLSGLRFLFQVQEPILDSKLFFVLTIFSSLISYFVYTYSIIRVNQRRFPRVLDRALFTIITPIVFILLIGFIGDLTFRKLFFVAGVNLYSGYMLAMLFEAVQTERVRAFKFHPFFAGIFLSAGVMSVFCLSSLALPLFVGYSHLVEIVWRFIAWILIIGMLAYTKYYQSGRRLYATKGYRPNSATIVINKSGQVLLCERNDRPGTIQTVQGGIDPGETPEQAARRELIEELGIWPENYEIKATLLNSKRYDWTTDLQYKLRHTGYIGQEQYFFLAEVADDVKFDLNFHYREFRKVWFDTPEQLLRLSWSKKRPGIEEALRGFGIIK